MPAVLRFLRRPGGAIAALLLLSLSGALAGRADPLDPLQPASGGGLELVDRALLRLATHSRLLVIGAHPDDEDTSLLSWIASRGGEGAYLSLSRGEGGQNLIGPELGVGLGLVRSEELLAARRLEGNRQFFTRAYDFGYTKTLAEALERWPREVLLKDAVRVVRRFRPQVIVSIFRDGESATHGQHQAAGVVAHEVFRLAADPDFDADAGLPPWSAEALYRRAWWRGEEEPTIDVPLTTLDPVSGRSWRQVAAASRSRHRSQDMGRLESLGDGGSRLVWVAGGNGAASASPFAGIDTDLAAIAEQIPAGPGRDEVADLLARAQVLAEDASLRLSPSALPELAPDLVEIGRHLDRARDGAAAAGAEAAADLIAEKGEWVDRAVLAAAGVVIDARADRERWAPGTSVEVTASLWNTSGQPIELRSLTAVRDGEASDALSNQLETVLPRSLGEWTAAVPSSEGPTSEGPTLPYFLEQPRVGDLYDWSGVAPRAWGEPFGDPPLGVRFDLTVAGRELSILREVVHVFADQARGEVRRPLRRVPAIEVTADPALTLLPRDSAAPPVGSITVRSHLAESAEGYVEIAAPSGWSAPSREPFTIADAYGSAVVDLAIEFPEEAEPGRYDLPVVAVVAGERYETSIEVTDYDHVRSRPRPLEAAFAVEVLDLELPATRVGWIVGVSDVVPTALERLGLEIETMSAAEAASVDLARFDTVVVGSRAYETDAALGAVNGKLLDYAREGGHLLVLYQQYQFSRSGFAPYPFEISRPHDRVTDETSPVRQLDPGHPVFRYPNPIGPADWDRWVQERGLYFGGSWGEEFTPLLALADPGEEEKLGALLVADLGAGSYVYTGLSFFREIPAGVPGAIRLLVNLIAYGDRGEDSP